MFVAAQSISLVAIASNNTDVCHRAFRILLLLILCFSGAARIANAQAMIGAGVVLDTPTVTLLKHVQEVNLALTVRNQHGHFVNNLTPSDLLILDNDERADQITYFESRSNLPLRVALVVDTSDSVTYCFDSERKTAMKFLKHVLRKDRDSALILNFNEAVRLAQPSTSDLRLLQQSLQRVHPAGETAIYDAVAMASQELGRMQSSQPSRRVIILITDGEDNRSHITLRQAAETALRSETAVYVISTNEPGFPDPQGDEAMKQLATATGGSFLRAGSDVGDAFAKIEKEFRSQYVIGYKPPQSSPDGQFHRLTILGANKLHFFHRVGYFAK
jgi:VWFA-related protein